ncbi:hypothetical protein A8135_12190 [Legionella jamestowniensis]|uniref:FAD-dependent urate hydroxylase HpyO FAD/NAD(P)-binding domain-containing protein n=1 Tax=Legionella jamestowniensis TaxID=455 RepID=A0ABX2XWT0_9GAMM|nr:hypothetical protein [Legionella jamestowniensis]OCH98309.1 hypothetical protein A8135_12190 [Legionella jamestowniensis]
MTVHVFVGVGPANLHRAIKIRKLDPNAEFIFIDKRLTPETEDKIDRTTARANIFRFENEDVTQKLLDEGVNLEGIIHQRQFDVKTGFQHGDDTVFSAKDFTQIQIRDLQIAFLKTLFAANKKPKLIPQTIRLDSNEVIAEDVKNVLKKNNIATHGEIKIHVATGALMDNEKQQEIIYPEKAQYFMPEATDDIKNTTVTPLHGTTTFIITNQITCDQLRDAQRSLDSTNWQEPLKQFGWSLVRPPRIRVFYANDILYIGPEIPAQMSSMKDKKDYEKVVTAYTRTIATLVFPDLCEQVAHLPVNPHLRSRFPTPRGESGNVMNSHENITIFHHGDRRYLPHYQTGSGFVTAFLQNELYAEIYACNTFEELVALAKAKSPETHQTLNADSLKDTYTKLIPENADESLKERLALEACQKEFFMAFSRDIIEENKKKVGRYLKALHSQELGTFANPVVLAEIINSFNRHHGTRFTSEPPLSSEEKAVFVVALLSTHNAAFLREVLPQLLNKDFSQVNDQQLFRICNMHILDYLNTLSEDQKKYLPTPAGIVERVLFRTTDSQDPVIKNLKNITNLNPEELATAIKTIASEFATKEELHHRAAISWFKGKHSETIHQFVKELKQIANEIEQPDLMGLQAIGVIMEFNKKLQAGHSRRTLQALEKITSSVLSSTESPLMLA